ncbi:MAG: GTPase [Desulfobacterales bacterium PC51MH44]|nr:MAG: GTPase [Desulfobacterales bacterium PC51MH44]
MANEKVKQNTATAKEEVQEKEALAPQEKSEKIIMNHVLTSMGVGLIAIPLVDLVALVGVQLNMLRKLAKSYNVPFSKDKGKHLIASLVGGGVSVPVAGILASLVKTVPVIGQTTGALAMPITAGAVTYAIGKVFTQHFASGGTFLSFDPEKVKNYYAEMLKEGKSVAAGLKS